MKKTEPSVLSKSVHEKAKKYFSSKEEYETKLKKLQKELIQLQQKIHRSEKKLLILLEGHDASGKGGVIKRITSYLDPRGIQVHSFSAPNTIEKKQHYMERFFIRLPPAGMITIFDRSWYGRVLVERVEKLCSASAWKRAYAEINATEKMLTDDGVILLKYFLDITHQEQKNRFEERKNNPLKAWKLSEEDWRNRNQWHAYYQSFQDMIKKTSTKSAPWQVIAADSKWYSRIKILENILDNCT